MRKASAYHLVMHNHIQVEKELTAALREFSLATAADVHCHDYNNGVGYGDVDGDGNGDCDGDGVICCIERVQLDVLYCSATLIG